jgi:hypothetical protein
MSSTVLLCHPDTPCAAVRRIDASIHAEPGGMLVVAYSLRGALDQVRIGSDTAAGEALWQHTCFELFLGATNDAEYYEFNFAPSGAWALLGFRGYRDGAPMHPEGLGPKISTRREGEELTLEAEIPLACLPGFQSGLQLSVGISAVVEEINGALSFWAIKHPPGRPDFHHPDNFAMQLDLPSAGDQNRDCAANA